jgi:uncharacterized protein (DUF58 family)
MPDSKEYLHPEAIRRISRMELRAHHVVEGFLSGMHRSPYFGQSVEFVQHRPYVPGDDLRHIDWKVWGRQDRLYIKQYEEDTNLRCTLMVDCSESMNYGRGPLNKFDYAATLASCLAYLIVRQQDAAGLATFSERIKTRLPWRSNRQHLNAIFRSLEQTKPSGVTDLGRVLSEARDVFPRRGLMVIVTDFLGCNLKDLKGLGALRQAGHDLMILHVMDDDELDFPFSDPLRFEGMELPAALACNPRALRDGYLEAVQRFLHDVKRTCAGFAADYRLVRTSEPMDAVLSAYLAARQAHMQRR